MTTKTEDVAGPPGFEHGCHYGDGFFVSADRMVWNIECAVGRYKENKTQKTTGGEYFREINKLCRKYKHSSEHPITKRQDLAEKWRE
jgi:hypothetical protein